MLGKLTKHEIIASGRLLLPMNIALIFASLVGKFLIWITSKKAFLDSTPIAFAKIVRGISSLFTIFYILFIFAVLIATVLFLVIRFYKNHYTDEGYLMLTLPVKPISLILSKLISAIVWSIISFSVVFCSIALILRTDETKESFKTLYAEFLKTLHRMAPEMNVSFGVLVAEIIVFTMILVITKYLMYFTSISVGHSYGGKNAIINSIVALIVIQIITQIISSGVIFGLSRALPNHINTFSGSGHALQSTVIVSMILNLLFCTAYLLITNNLIKTKVNLD